MVRLEKADFADDATVARLASAGGLDPDEFRRHFARLDVQLSPQR